MLQIKTYLNNSKIHGIGVFADQNISEGQIIWIFNPDIDKIIELKENFTLNESVFLSKYAYLDKQLEKHILCSDNDRFTNHSDDPNTVPLATGEVVAKRNIKQGEELTINYFDIDSLTDEKEVEEEEIIYPEMDILLELSTQDKLDRANEKFETVGFVDWNKFSLDYLADYLDEKWWYQSSGEALAIHKMIAFYRENKGSI